ncbi:SRPBCC family protein [Geodermatophilus chilensis]|uniref:SRPBCC family protein n=1 Tax=Geodermatophilus chilensis TaxID=2035835 RepID=UPI0018E4BE2B|nr:SRPBCC family protein [Geodermatophilus chilensis]
MNRLRRPTPHHQDDHRLDDGVRRAEFRSRTGTPGRSLTNAVLAGGVAAVVSGLPSTLSAVRIGGDPLEASLAAGTVLLRDEQRASRLLPAAALVHAGMSLGWALVLAATLPARRTMLAAGLSGGLAGAAIAALDLGLVGRRLPRIRRLPVLPQLADHVAYGAVVGSVLAARAGRAGEVVAVRSVGTAPERVFEFLADLRNHWLLEDRFVELRGLDGDEGSGPRGGRVRLTGPLGISREARTRVLSARPPTATRPGRLAGRADIGRRTTGRVAWEIAVGKDGGSRVTLRAAAERASLLDRTLLLLGRWWLQHTFDRALANLDRILEPAPSVRPLLDRKAAG